MVVQVCGDDLRRWCLGARRKFRQRQIFLDLLVPVLDSISGDVAPIGILFLLLGFLSCLVLRWLNHRLIFLRGDSLVGFGATDLVVVLEFRYGLHEVFELPVVHVGSTL